MGAQAGYDCKLFYVVGGQTATGDYTELANIRGDLNLGLTKDDIDATTRGNAGWKAHLGGLKDAEVTFEMAWDSADADFEVFQDAFLNGTVLGCKILDGAEATGSGLWADFEVFDFSRSEPLNDLVVANVTMRPAYGSVAPRWISDGTWTDTGSDTGSYTGT